MALFSWRKTKKKNKDDAEMSFLDHLEALRWHILRSIVAILVFAIFLFSYRVEIIGGVFMSPFDKDFVTYRILCDNFGQLCNNDIRVQEVEVESPDSLTLEGYIWLPVDANQSNNAQNNPSLPGNSVPDVVSDNGSPGLNENVPTPNPSDPDPNENAGDQEVDDEPVSPDSLGKSEDSSATDRVDSFPIAPSDTPLVDSPDSGATPAVKGPEMQRQPVRLKVSVEQFLTNGKVNGFSVQTEQGTFVKFQATSPYEQFMKALLYAFFGGLILAFPYVVWEIWRFVQPALNKKERGMVRWNVFYSSLLFFLGVLFGYYIILPFSITFLSSFILFDEAENIWRIGDVVNFVLVLLFGSGFLFQLPVGIYYASKIGFVTPKWLRKYRKHAVVVLLAIAAIITPPDPASQILIFLPLIGLYEIGIGISGRVLRRKQKRDAAEKAKDDEWRRKKEEEYKQRLKEQEKKALEEAEKSGQGTEEQASKEGGATEGDDVGNDEGDDAGEGIVEEKKGNDAGEGIVEEKKGEDAEDDDDKDDDDDDFDLRPPEGVISRDD